ncbi:SNARE-associated protein Snapin-like [Varroa jacobsoni]|uniref:SNARE-associated protein Snapin-like n=1 Tax=Varroa jacobsoni TaxID=62625 RepID=UPI000BF4B1AE|nr:SNARE-associated protein Snapin-like [Varroa jacobsoni]XP_022692472.1 SNARE-associated protein Snapin-like [Varroa jacobsoni]XP_022692473.1 SNARE-associated protein Snapin-like [Varroa jacobsoni]XP_022692474.1 SNARE-associated protein Snapin-like [Varroa jacobsoni]XP_022692475.1 SNARE-associated protein Snapin-like [Varroa jacobsoni]
MSNSDQSGENVNALTEGLTALLTPCIAQLEHQVSETQKSQQLLGEQIDALSVELRRITDCTRASPLLDSYIKKLLVAKRKIIVVNSVLQATQERAYKLQENIRRNTAKYQVQLETGAL